MATYQGEAYLKEQLESIIPQLSENDQLVISDDGSTDGTSQIVMGFSDPRICFFCNINRTGHPKDNFESALLHANGDIYVLSDQDDIWYPDRINRIRQHFRNGGLGLLLSNALIIDRDGRKTGVDFFS